MTVYKFDFKSLILLHDLGAVFRRNDFHEFCMFALSLKNPHSNTTHSDLVNSVKTFFVIMGKENISYDLRLAICLFRLPFLKDINPEYS